MIEFPVAHHQICPGSRSGAIFDHEILRKIAMTSIEGKLSPHLWFGLIPVIYG